MGPHADNEKLPGFEARRGPQSTTLEKATQPWYERVSAGRLTATEGDLAFVRALYDDAIWNADRQIGALFDAARGAKRGGRTILVFASDHGELLADPGGKRIRLGHGNMLNEVLLHVPLFIAAPGIAAGVEKRHIVELVDVAPTLAALTGLQVEPEWAWDGTPILGATAEYGDIAISERAAWESRQTSIRSLADAVTYTPPKGWKNAYDVEADPMHGAPVKPWTAAQTALFARLLAYVADAHPQAPGEKTSATPEELEMLKALGYTGD
jgi:arylsulfatase A-like enzyme